MVRKKRRRDQTPVIHPRNRYSEKPPDFGYLSSLYPSFLPYVSYSSHSKSAKPSIDWTDFNATRELTRILLLHDHAVHWWIPDGQLCPTVPNRSNYVHWIGDLLSSDIIPGKRGGEARIRGFDIGTGANCIYPLLGASLYGWSFVGSDITEVALEWARKNVEANPHLSHLIEIRNAAREIDHTQVALGSQDISTADNKEAPNSAFAGDNDHGAPVLVGVVGESEEFDFCICNPPFFKHMEESGLNPKTACGGTYEEMVYPGGELAFITRIIEESQELKQSFRWFTSMVGRKANLKLLVSKLRDVGVSIVKTTEFVQGQTSRWGLSWSFISPNKKLVLSQGPPKSHHSFMIEGLQRQFGAIHVLKATESFFLASAALYESDLASFCINVTFPSEQINVILEDNNMNQICNGSSSLQCPQDGLKFRVSVFEHIPGTILVEGSLQHRKNPLSGVFSLLVHNLEEHLRNEFVKKKHLKPNI